MKWNVFDAFEKYQHFWTDINILPEQKNNSNKSPKLNYFVKILFNLFITKIHCKVTAKTWKKIWKCITFENFLHLSLCTKYSMKSVYYMHRLYKIKLQKIYQFGFRQPIWKLKISLNEKFGNFNILEHESLKWNIFEFSIQFSSLQTVLKIISFNEKNWTLEIHQSARFY